ncbi:MAG: hypothetical protein ACTS5P_00945 [Candidatus Hodgkinia cicadicola]
MLRGRFSHFDRSCNVQNTSVAATITSLFKLCITITAICLNNLTFHQYLQLFPLKDDRPSQCFH